MSASSTGCASGAARRRTVLKNSAQSPKGKAAADEKLGVLVTFSRNESDSYSQGPASKKRQDDVMDAPRSASQCAKL